MLREAYTRILSPDTRALLRGPAIAALAVGSAFGLVAFGQDSIALRRHGITGAWPGVATMLVAVSCWLPLGWLLQKQPDADAWERRLCSAPGRLAFGRSVDIVVAGSLTVGGLGLICLTLNRILVGDADIAAATSAVIRAVLALFASAALAPAVAVVFRTVPRRVAIWVLLSASSLGPVGRGIPVPLDRLLSRSEPRLLPEPGTLVSVAAATLAGLAVSVVATMRTRPDRRTQPCASASSETSTATSRR